MRPNFQLQNYSCAQHFWKFRCLQVFHFQFFCAIQQRATVLEIRRSPVEDVEASDAYWWDAIIAITPGSNYFHFSTTLQTGNMWTYASDDSRWVHNDAVICVPPKINTHFVTTLPTPKVDISITASLSINGSARLVSMNECIVQTRSSYRELFRPYSYNRQRDMFHPIMIVVFWLIQILLLRIILPKRSGQ